ncbi:MAG TPA: hypothetical protein VKB38_14120 [Terracidiphilus sp.]|nr:hypothetical protein [Terracidiphilus sp.]
MKGTQTTILPLSLRYDDPKAYPIGTKQSAIIGDFKCGSDGSIFLIMLDDSAAFNKEIEGGSNPDSGNRFHVTELTPSGGVVRFTHTQDKTPGLRNFAPEVRYFVSSSRIYSLERAEVFDPADPGPILGHAHLIEIYGYDGDYKGIIRLEAGLDPLTIAAFPSGDILVVSLDKLNQTTRLLVFDQKGSPVTELRLFDENYTSKLKLGDKAGTPSFTPSSISTKLALAHWVLFGENLLMSPTMGSNLPLIELNESGVVRSTNVAWPENVYLTGILESSDKIYHVVGGERKQLENSGSDSNDPKFSYIPNEIDDINPGDGTILKRVKFASGLWPVCAQDDTYTFLSPRDEDGRLQVTRGTVTH